LREIATDSGIQETDEACDCPRPDLILLSWLRASLEDDPTTGFFNPIIAKQAFVLYLRSKLVGE
jgi:hypothetical protein